MALKEADRRRLIALPGLGVDYGDTPACAPDPGPSKNRFQPGRPQILDTDVNGSCRPLCPALMRQLQQADNLQK